ncbi:sterol desaturase family protein [Polaribacter sp. Hel_I_88]|uniref:sterol desaturase family protein n=1 Tax=Polaribacter sp. Hel_I_88 TaxID=1250006 RepID=UPI000479C463|nr:sterol desaturase family protein [Polaribacter sp. Hel_I_88]
MKNMASDNHFLLQFFASRNPKFVLLKITPILIGYFFVLLYYDFVFYKVILTFLLGVLSWSLFEYFVHRVGYHKRTKNKKLQWYLDAMHLHHHNNLKDYGVLNAGFLLMYPLTVLVLTFVYLLTNNVALTVGFGLGMTFYYLFYEYVHYQIHKKYHKKGYLNLLQKYHLYHHYNNWNKNFGNTTTIWDKIFKTYDIRYKKLILTENQLKDLIQKE